MISVTDSQGNSYIPVQQGSSVLGFAVFTPSTPFIPGTPPSQLHSRKALSTSDTFTITLSGNATGCVAAWGIPGQPVVDVNVLNGSNGGNGTTATVTGTSRQAGETALALFAWADAGGAGRNDSTFTQLAQQHATGVAYLTVVDASPAVPSSLTATYTIASAAWQGVLLTFSSPYDGAYLVTSTTGPVGQRTYTVPVQQGSPLAPTGLPELPAGDGAVLVIALTGSTTPAVQSPVTDTKGNTWTQRQNPATGGGLHLIVFTCQVTNSLTTADNDHLTVTFPPSPTPPPASAPAFVLVGASQRGQVDVSTGLVSGPPPGSPSVTSTPAPANGGEVVLACFAWGQAGGAGAADPAWTRIGQAQTGGGAFATVDYYGGYGGAQPNTAVTSAPKIDTTNSPSWRAIMISFRPTATLWFTHTTFITAMDSADHNATSKLFGSLTTYPQAQGMAITTDTGLGPPNQGPAPLPPGSLPNGYNNTTPILKYTSFAQFLFDLTAGQNNTSVIPPDYKWLMYDNEYSKPTKPGQDNGWPTPIAEADDPWYYMRQFVEVAHEHGYRVILAPARDLYDDPTTVMPVVSGEGVGDWYLRTGIAYAAAAAGADVVHIQCQDDQASPATTFDDFFDNCAAQVAQASGYCRLTAGVSTTSPPTPPPPPITREQIMHDSATAVADVTQGYWLNLSTGTNGTVSIATAFEDSMV